MRKLGFALLLCLFSVIGCNTPPSVVLTLTPGTAAVAAGQSVTIMASVAAPPGVDNGVTWRLASVSATPGVLSNITATSVTYTAPATIPASFLAEVEATPNAQPLSSQTAGINVDNPLVVTSTTLTAGTVNLPYNVPNASKNSFSSTGGTGTFSYAITAGSLPPGLTLASTITPIAFNGAVYSIPAGSIYGTPTVAGLYSFTVTETDSEFTPVSASANVTLYIAPLPLQLAATAPPVGVVGTPYTFAFVATGGIPPYTFSVSTGRLPLGLTLSSTGVLSGTPTGTGAYKFTVQVVDSQATPLTLTSTASYTVNVYSPFAITAATLPQGAVKTPYTATLTSTGGSGTVVHSLASGTLPAGLALSAAGVISGSPTAAGVGTSTFSVLATDTLSGQTATAPFSITVILSSLAITTTALATGVQNQSYSQTLTSSGGVAPITWSLAAGSTLPAGLTLSTAGVLSGIPMASGTFSETIQATDSVPATVSKTFSLVISPVGTLVVTTSTLPNGTSFTPYTTTLAATGGLTPYTWTVTSGALPAGITLSSAGVLSGTPLANGTFTITFQVKDSSATPNTATRLLTLTIAGGAANARLSGNYAFLLNGYRAGNTAGAVYGFAALGSLAADGAGNVTGVEDINTPTGAQQSIAVTGFYTVNADGRGLLSLTAGTTTNTYALAVSRVVSGIAQNIAMTEFDNTDGTGSTATGFARHQTTGAFIPGTLGGAYAFGLSGESPCNTCSTPAPLYGPVVVAGTVTGNGTSAFTTGTEDAAAFGTNYTSVAVAGTFTTPSTTTGRGTLTLVPGGAIFAAPPTNYTYVIVSSSEFLLLSIDSHATNTLLSGDAQFQQIPAYTTANTLAVRSIGYESRATGGNGSSTYPGGLGAILTALTPTTAGSATVVQDANRAGTFTAEAAAAAVTYTTATNGRVALTSASTGNQVVYLYNTGSGFGLEVAGTGTFPALVQYEQQIFTSTLQPFPSGSLATGTLAPAIPATISSGYTLFSNASGGADVGYIGGATSSVLDSSTPAGVRTTGATAGPSPYLEDPTGRTMVLTTGSTVPVAIEYAISATRVVGISTTGTVPTVSISQQ